MPVYIYKCENCSETFEVKHGMSETQESCIFCKSEIIFKVPAISNVKKRHFKISKPGKIVDEYIKETKKELKDEKQRIKKEEF